MDDAVTLELDRDALRPGGEVTGVVRWRLGRVPAGGELRLRWETAGKGDVDREVVGVAALATLPRASAARADGGAHPFRDGAGDGDAAPLAATDARRFRVRLPTAPYSFDGKLISLRWTLEVDVDGAIARATLVVGPGARAVSL